VSDLNFKRDQNYIRHPVLVYLAGAIENAPDGGTGWRREISEFLVNELNHNSFNPCLEENHVLSPQEFRQFRQWKTTNLQRFRKTIRKIINNDITILTKRISYIICLWDEFVLSGGGTQGELTVAFLNDIPVYMVTPFPLKKISSWIIGCTTEIFTDFSTLKQFLLSKYRVHL
jgi:hypothetical protein